MEALATVEDLQTRLDFQMDEGQQADAGDALEQLSDDARDYGKQAWIDPASAPEQVVRLVLRAAKRYIKNPDGYNQSRSADETVGWANEWAKPSAEFTSEEKKKLRRLAEVPELYSVPLTAWHTKAPRGRVGCVPSEGDNRPFPVFYDDERNLPPLWREDEPLPIFYDGDY